VSRRTVCEVTTVWLGRSDWSRRDTRQRVKRLGSGPIGGGGDSPVAHRAPRYRHDCAPSRGSHQPPPSSSVRARTSRFSAATTRSEVPAIPSSLRQGAPVNRRYGHVEDALAGAHAEEPADRGREEHRQHAPDGDSRGAGSHGCAADPCGDCAECNETQQRDCDHAANERV